MDEARNPIPGDAFADDRTLPDETDPATGESADDALEATRTVSEYLMPAEDASPRSGQLVQPPNRGQHAGIGVGGDSRSAHQ